MEKYSKNEVHESVTGLVTGLCGKIMNYGLGRKLASAAGALLLSLSLAAAPAFADVVKKSASGKEAVVKQVSNLIETDPTNGGNMAKAISILNTNSSVLRGDIRFPLLMSQAYYCSADPSADIDKTYPYYEKAGAYARQAIEMNSGSPEAHYWYGLYLLKKAQKQGGISAYFTAKKGISELELVRKYMPAYDHGGASRVLALLYYIAPGWSPFGDIDKSIRLATEAKRIDPNYPLNVLYLANAFNKKRDREGAMREYKALLALPASAYSGKQAGPFREKARTMLAALENGAAN